MATTTFTAEGGPQQGSYSVHLRSVSPDYFQTLGIRVLRGRTFQEADDGEQSHVAIVNDELARHYWPNEDPIGKRVSRAEHPQAAESLTGGGAGEATRHRRLHRP